MKVYILVCQITDICYESGTYTKNMGVYSTFDKALTKAKEFNPLILPSGDKVTGRLLEDPIDIIKRNNSWLVREFILTDFDCNRDKYRLTIYEMDLDA